MPGFDMSKVDKAFIDTAFDEEAKRLGKGTGALQLARFGRTRFGDVFPEVYSRQRIITEIEALADQPFLESLVIEIMDQGNEGSCVSFCFSQAFQIIAAKQYGMDKVVKLSPISLYKRIGNSPNSGAMVSDGWDETVKDGILPRNTPENIQRFKHTMQPTGFYTKYPGATQDEWKQTARLFRGVECFICDTIEEMYTASLMGCVICVGRLGHSIPYVRPVIKDGRLAMLYPNSWNRWGFGAGSFDYGFGLDTENVVRQSAYWAVAFRTVNFPTLDNTPVVAA